MSGRGRGSVGGGRGQQYSNVGSRGGHDGGSRGGRGDGSRGGRGDGSRGGRGRGRSPATYKAPQMESEYQSPPSPAPSVSTLTRDVATKVNIQSSGTASESSSQPSSSSVSVSTPPRLMEGESSVQKHVPPPASSKAMRFPSRPGFGTVGQKCIVKANHFLVEFDINKDIHHYDVTIIPEIASKKVSRRIIRQLVSNFKQSHLGNRILAYDGRRSAYTAGPLPFTSKEFVVTLSDEDDDASSRRQKEYKVSIKFAAKADLHHLLEFLNRNQVDAPQETIQALDVVLRDTPSAKYETVGRSFFSPHLGTKDISARPFYEPILVTEFITKLLNIRNLTRPLPAQDFVKKMVNGGKVDFWTCISFSRSGLDVAEIFCERLLDMCCSKGMVFSPSFLPFQSGHPGQIEKCLINIQNQSIAKFKSWGLDGKRIQLLIVILPDISGSYGTIKRVCETKLGIVSQCCQPERVLGANIQYLENVALKINVKVGGRNTVLEQAVQRKIPFLTDVPIIFFGADVTHPSRGEGSIPSIAAVVGSMNWPEVTKYRGLVSAQNHRKEIIQDLYKKFEDPQNGVVHTWMIRELLRFLRLNFSKAR